MKNFEGEHSTPENALLLLCARSHKTVSLTRQINLLINTKIIDWNILVHTAAQHRVLPLLYKNLQDSCQEFVPDHVLKQLRAEYMTNGAHNLFLACTLLKILTLFSDNNIQAVAFKGPLLTVEVYGNLALRSIGDLDILIALQDMELAICLLLEQGYKTNFQLPLEKYLKLVQRGHHANLIHSDNGSVVELHWEMTGRYCSHKMTLNSVNQRLVHSNLLEQSLSNLGLEDLLLYLCIHGNRHQWKQLDAICCIAELISKNTKIDWDRAITLAKKFNAKRMFFLGLALSHDLFDTSLPRKVLDIVTNERAVEPITKQIKKELFSSENLQRDVKYHLKGVLFHYRTLGHPPSAIKYAFRKFCTPDGYDLEWLPLPVSLWFIYPTLRPLRFIVEQIWKHPNTKKD